MAIETEFNLPYDLLNNHMKCFSDLSTWGKKGEVFVHLHLSPIVKFPVLSVCTSRATEIIPTGSKLCIRRIPRMRNRKNSHVSSEQSPLWLHLPKADPNLLNWSLYSMSEVQEELQLNVREVCFNGLLCLPILVFFPISNR